MRNNIVGTNIRVIRNSKGWTQSKLATQCQLQEFEMSRETIAKVESGVRLITDSEVVLFASILDTSVIELFDVPDLQCRLK
ncbi:helix-turn-helix domain-containing protein [Vibrio diabolicus]|uniref:helix-turn-helix domain-containing protein n=1 Tax=Vibrio diabolicus TaxID=50719 RepID=UPI0035A88D7E